MTDSGCETVMTQTVKAIRSSKSTYTSHPPMRPFHKAKDRPMSGNAKVVDTARGSDANDGSEREPWKTITHAIEHLQLSRRSTTAGWRGSPPRTALSCNASSKRCSPRPRQAVCASDSSVRCFAARSGRDRMDSSDRSGCDGKGRPPCRESYDATS